MASDIRGPRVLVVEDDALLRRLVVRALQIKTDSVVPCADATAARAALGDGPFDAAAVDINLPDGSGLEVIERIRSLNPEAGIVAVTGHVGVDVAVRSMKAGADDFLTKPFEVEVLWHIIKKSVGSRMGRIEAERASAYRELAYTDALTGAPNRRFIDERLSDELDRAGETGQSVSVAYLDIDNFKLLNDFAGHDQGDLVLKECVKVLREEIVAPAAFARFGGDEFVVVFPNGSDSQVTSCIERVRASVSHFVVAGTAFPIAPRMSVGIAGWDGTSSPRSLIAEAERRMYIDKSIATFPVSGPGSALLASPGWIERFRTLRGLVKAIDRRDAYTRFHSDHATSIALEVGRRAGLPEANLMSICIAGPIHDLGKLVVPDEILQKPGRLNREERRSMQDHPAMGAVIAAAVTDLSDVVSLIRHHHERFDGNGYPGGLRAEEVDAPIRLFSIADAYSAMVTDRPYRQALTREAAIQEVEDGLGSQFDPDLGREFIKAALERVDITALTLSALPKAS